LFTPQEPVALACTKVRGICAHPRGERSCDWTLIRPPGPRPTKISINETGRDWICDRRVESQSAVAPLNPPQIRLSDPHRRG
jgi:hypothetical protein